MADEKVQLAKSSTEFVEDLHELRNLEDRKRREPISTERYHDLAEEVTAKSREIMRDAALQEDLGNRTETGDVSIDDLSRDGTPET